MTEIVTKKIRFGHSPDPDDAFMFYAFEKKTIPMQGFEVSHVMEDIEALNQRALQKAELEVTAVSCHAYAYLADKYAVMRSGASIGDKYGPILVVKPGFDGNVKGKKIAIPGKLTTAYLAMQIYEKDFETVFTPFDQILESVRDGKVDLGLVIHEGQLTYKTFGLEKFLDLGTWWHEKYDLPLPLGVDIIRKDLGPQTMAAFSKLFRASIEHSLANRKPALDYAIEYGRGLDDALNDKFVGMYVNELTVDLGPRGEEGFKKLLDEGYAAGFIPHQVNIEFI